MTTRRKRSRTRGVLLALLSILKPSSLNGMTKARQALFLANKFFFPSSSHEDVKASYFAFRGDVDATPSLGSSIPGLTQTLIMLQPC